MTRSSRQIEEAVDAAGDVLKALFDLYYKLKSASSNLGGGCGRSGEKRA